MWKGKNCNKVDKLFFGLIRFVDFLRLNKLNYLMIHLMSLLIHMLVHRLEIHLNLPPCP